jgi:hypothetical protein
MSRCDLLARIESAKEKDIGGLPFRQRRDLPGLFKSKSDRQSRDTDEAMKPDEFEQGLH